VRVTAARRGRGLVVSATLVSWGRVR
jgi:hypothetical protein